MVDSLFFCTLSHEGVLSIRGADASKFLQGQVTCNLNYLSRETSTLGARCTPKGRMVSSFRLVQEEDGLLMALARELVEPQLADLKKYAVFSKSVLADESTSWIRFGASAETVRQAWPALDVPEQTNRVAYLEELKIVRLSGERVELWAPQEHASSVRDRLTKVTEEAPLERWLLEQIRAGVGQVFGPTRELFIPQMINLQAVDGVSFKKGCYTGQEIVARMQYLGKLKRRLFRLSVHSDAPEPGTALFSPVHTTSVGEVVLAAHAGDMTELLAVLQLDAQEDGRIHLGALEGPLCELLDLPYTIDTDREIQR
ncbi:YgfZ/GcvT domain-containing protein [Pseudomonas duriflava]|nr:folate-binding protein YgfZ [Pseudomonas duriflava]